MKILRCLLILLFVLVFSVGSSAYDSSKASYRGGISLFYGFSQNLSNQFDLGYALKFGYDYRLYNKIKVGANLGVGELNAINPAWDSMVIIVPLNFTASYRFMNQPKYYLEAVGGPLYHTIFGMGNDRLSSLGFNLGLRLNYQLSPKYDLQFELTAHEWIEEGFVWKGTSELIEFSVCVSLPSMLDPVAAKKVKTKYEDKSPVLAKESGRDSDGDGVPDLYDKSPGTPAGVSVDDFGRPLDLDKDGVPDHIDLGKNTPVGVIVDGRGRPVDTDRDRIPDYRDRQTNSTQNAKVDNLGRSLDGDRDGIPDAEDLETNTHPGFSADSKGRALYGVKSGVIENLSFQAGKASFTQDSYPALFKLFVGMYVKPGIRIELRSYTDSSGSPDVNLRLSQARADAVKSYLVGMGISPESISAQGFGAENFITSDPKSPENRRIEIIVRQYSVVK